MLTLHQVAALMDRRYGRDKPVPFSITYLSHDSRRGRSGEIRVLHKAYLPKPIARAFLARQRQNGEVPIIDVRPQGIAHPVRVHFDLILTINSVSVE